MGRKKTIDKMREAARKRVLALIEVASLRQLEIITAFLETLADHPDY